jgi:hypothetical protein
MKVANKSFKNVAGQIFRNDPKGRTQTEQSDEENTYAQKRRKGGWEKLHKAELFNFCLSNTKGDHTEDQIDGAYSMYK